MTALLAFLVVITVVVFFHELGHWAAARLVGVRVDELSIGFGRELFGFNKYGTRWKFSAVPLGGYVKIHGMEEKSRDKDAICNKSAAANIWVFFAGPLANLIFAWLMFCGLFLALGSPIQSPKIGEVIEDSAAEQVGIEGGDTILTVNEIEIIDFGQAARIIGEESVGELRITVLRGNKELTFEVTPKLVEGRRLLGITATAPSFQKIGALQAIGDAATETYKHSAEVVAAIGGIFSGESLDQLGGPIQIARFSGNFWQEGVAAFCFFLAIISINLGLINLMPIPPLDGGRIAFKFIAPLFGRRAEVLERFGMAVGLFLIVLLLVVATWNDILRIF